MLFGIPAEQIVPIANFIGLGLLGLLAAFGHRWGKSQPTPVEKSLEVAGALVDSGAVKQLAAAIEAHTLEAMSQRHDSEKSRQATYRLIEIAVRMVDEMEELRRAVADVANQVARMK